MLVETLFGALGALAVLAFVFASFLAFVPLIIAAVSILTTFLLVLGLTYLTDVSFVVQFLIALVGLGVAIDYSLLLVSRWREERAHGRTNDEAVVVAVQTAGHAVLASGVTVAISLLALIVVPVPFLRSMGLGGMLIPLVSVAVVLTLLPALLSKHRAAGRLAADPARRRRRPQGWSAWARLVVRRRWVAAGVAAGRARPASSRRSSGCRSASRAPTSLARSGPAYEALRTLTQRWRRHGRADPDRGARAAGPGRRRGQGRRRGRRRAHRGARRHRRAAPPSSTSCRSRETVDSSANEVVDRVRTAVADATDGTRRGRRAPARSSRTTSGRSTTTSPTSSRSSR